MDAELVIRAQSGDRAAFTALASASFSRLHRVAQGILRDLDLADDATQQAIVDIWLRLPQLRDATRFEAWSYRVLVNSCYLEARRRRRWLPGLASETPDRPGGADAMAGVVLRDQLERAFRQLPVDQRAVVVLRDYLDLPFGAVAEALGIPTGTAYSRHHRAMQALRAALEADSRADRRAADAERAP